MKVSIMWSRHVPTMVNSLCKVLMFLPSLLTSMAEESPCGNTTTHVCIVDVDIAYRGAPHARLTVTTWLPCHRYTQGDGRYGKGRVVTNGTTGSVASTAGGGGGDEVPTKTIPITGVVGTATVASDAPSANVITSTNIPSTTNSLQNITNDRPGNSKNATNSSNLLSNIILVSADLLMLVNSKWYRYNFHKGSSIQVGGTVRCQYVGYDSKNKRLIYGKKNNIAIGYLIGQDLTPEYLRIGGTGVTSMFAMDTNEDRLFLIGTITIKDGGKCPVCIYSLSTVEGSDPLFIKDVHRDVPVSGTRMAIDIKTKTLYMVTEQVDSSGFQYKRYISGVSYSGQETKRTPINKGKTYGLVFDSKENVLLYVNKKNMLVSVDPLTDHVTQLPYECPKSTKLIVVADDRIILLGSRQAFDYDRQWERKNAIKLERGVQLAVLVDSSMWPHSDAPSV